MIIFFFEIEVSMKNKKISIELTNKTLKNGNKYQQES